MSLSPFKDCSSHDFVQMQMYGLIRNDHNTVRIANRIFETMLYNLFLSDEELKNNVFSREGELAKNICIEDGRLNMRLIMERFIASYTQILRRVLPTSTKKPPSPKIEREYVFFFWTIAYEERLAARE